MTALPTLTDRYGSAARNRKEPGIGEPLVACEKCRARESQDDDGSPDRRTARALRWRTFGCPKAFNLAALSIADFDLCDIFALDHSFGESDFTRLEALMEMLKEGAACVELAQIPAARKCGKRKFHPPLDLFSGRTPQHRELCARAVQWLWSRGIAWENSRALDAGYGSYRADVISDDGSVIVECGYTKASKAIDALAKERRFLIIPYPEEIGLLTEIGFLFTPDARREDIDRYRWYPHKDRWGATSEFWKGIGL